MLSWLVAAAMVAFVGCASSDDDGDDEDAGASGSRDTGSFDATFLDALPNDTASGTDTASPDAGADTAAPDDTTPEDTTPDDTTPEDTTPDDTTPEDTAPDDVTPEDVTPDAAGEVGEDVTPAVELCDNDMDDDGDARVDCDDPDCSADPSCVTTGGSGTCADPSSASLGANTGVPTVDEQSPSCLSIDDNEVVFVFTPSRSGTYCADTRGSVADDTLVSMQTVCGDLATELECYDDITTPERDFQAYGTWSATAGEPVYLLVDTYNVDLGDSVTLTITEGACPAEGPGDGGGGDPTDVTDVACSVDAGVAFPTATPSDTFLFRCPADCTDTFAVVYGTDVYADDSDLCRAAIHSGEITDAGGTARVTFLPGQDEYFGSERNGVTSLDWLFGWDQSFSVSASR